MSAFAHSIEVECRACGATHAPVAREIANVCQYCWDHFVRHIGKSNKTKQNFTRWLARSLFMNAERMRKCGVAGRCEAVSWANGGWLYDHGKQCRGIASRMRAGRRVCGQHWKATNIHFVGDIATDPYRAMTRVMAELAMTDPLFRQCLIEALRTPTLTQPTDRSAAK